MITLTRTDSSNPDFVSLTQQLDIGLALIDGDSHNFYSQFNKIDQLQYVIVAYKNGQAIGCGAIKPYDSETMEIKRMFTANNHRGLGIATQVLTALEHWSFELNFRKCILETGPKHITAVALYHKNQYQVIPNYGQYKGLEESICFQKIVSSLD